MPKKFIFSKQQDQMDCGPTCLKMVCDFYGRKYSISSLRKKAFLTREGANLLGISNAAESIGFRTMAVKLPISKLAEDIHLPFIAHWNQNHFVVVYKITKHHIHVADPAYGKVVYTNDEFSHALSSNENQKWVVALLLEPLPAFFNHDQDEQDRTPQGVRYLASHLKTYQRYFIQLAIGLFLGSLIQLAIPFLAQSVVDIGIAAKDVGFIYLVLVGHLALLLSKIVIDLIRRWILLHISTRINLTILSEFLTKLMKLPINFFDSKTIGDLLQRLDDHTRIEKLLTASTLNVLFSLFNVLVFGTVLAIYSVKIFVIFLAFSIAYVIYSILFLKKRKEIDYKKFSQLSVNQSSIVQMIYGMPEIKLNNAETKKRWEWERIQAKIFRLNVKSMKLMQFQDAGGFFINDFKNILITCVAALAAMNGEITIGMMLAIQFIIGQLNAPITDFIAFIRDVQDARIALDRVAEIKAHENEDTDIGRDNPSFAQIPSGDLNVSNVNFNYFGPGTADVIKGLDLTISKGKITAIVGTSGSGKTTLLKLLLKFYSPTSGKIYLDGVDLDKISSSEWRKKCGVVMQDGYIFSDTIAGNIAMTWEDIDHDRMQKAVTIANIKKDIDSMPLGFSTKIGSNGLGLSQGQKQRLLIARAVYKNPEYIFFDEATSSLDANNEKAIMEHLAEFFKGKTVIVIAHRLSTVKNADQIVVLEQGRIMEVGSHSHLTKSNGLYYNLVKNQLELGS